MQIGFEWPALRRAEIRVQILLLSHAHGTASQFVLVGFQKRTSLAALRPDVDLLTHRSIRFNDRLNNLRLGLRQVCCRR